MFHSLPLLYVPRRWSQHVHHEPVENIVHRCCPLTAFYTLWALYDEPLQWLLSRSNMGPSKVLHAALTLFILANSSSEGEKWFKRGNPPWRSFSHVVLRMQKKKKILWWSFEAELYPCLSCCCRCLSSRAVIKEILDSCTIGTVLSVLWFWLF